MVIDNRVLVVNFSPNNFCVKTKEVHQYDHGLQLRVRGLENFQQAHFANKDMAKAINVLTSYQDGEI
jgi:hypothetical protein